MIFKQPSQHQLLEQKREIWQEGSFYLYLSSGSYFYFFLYCLFIVSKGFVVITVFEFKLCRLLTLSPEAVHFKLCSLIFFYYLEIIVGPPPLFFEIMSEGGLAQCLGHNKSSIDCNYYNDQLASFYIELKILRKGTQCPACFFYLLQCFAYYISLHINMFCLFERWRYS